MGALGSSDSTTGQNEENIEKLKRSLTGLQEKIAALEGKPAKKVEKTQIPVKG